MAAATLHQAAIGSSSPFPKLETNRSHTKQASILPQPSNKAFVYHPKFYCTKFINGLSNNNISTHLVSAKVSSQAGHTLPDVNQLKIALKNSLQGMNRGIFGVGSDKKAEIESLLEQLEEKNPTLNLADNLHLVDGSWKLLYSTVTILGSKRTKLGLRDFVKLGEFIQTINTNERKAKNTIEFTVAGLSILTGELTIDASFNFANDKRVDIQYEKSSIKPQQLLNIFKKNYDLLLSIFNPEGWLELTYLDTNTRIGRDNKGNIFLLEKL